MQKALFFFIFVIFNAVVSFAKEVQNDTIFSHYKKEIQLAHENNNLKKVALNQFELGKHYANNYVNTQAIQSFNKALTYYQEKPADSMLVLLNNEIGKVYFSINNYSSALNYFAEALEISKQNNFLPGKANALSLMGSANEKLGEYLKALQLQNESLKVYKKLNDDNGIAKTYENMGSIYEDLNQFKKAHTYFYKAYDLLKNSNTFLETDVLNNLGDVYRKQGDYSKSIPYTQKALVLAEKLNDIHLQESAHKDLSKAYSLLGNFKKAFEHRVKSEEFKELALITENTKQVNTLKSVYDLDKKETEIRLLKEQNKVSDINQKLLLFGLLSVVTVAGILFYFIGKKRKSNQKLQEYKQRILQAELDKKQVQEAEMKRNITLKTASLSKYSLSLSQKNKNLADIASSLKKIAKRDHIDFKKKIKEIAKEIEFNLKQDDEMEEFNSLFNEIHPDFSKNLTKKANDKLTPAEIKLAMLLRLNLSSKEIASILKVTPDSVRVARHRLRKKLPINSKKELVNFMLEV